MRGKLYGVGIGLDKSHLTLKAIEVIREADEVIVPGNMARNIIADIREPRVVEFPMGGSDDVARKLGEELAKRCINERIAFCCIGDPVFYSTFHHVVKEVLRINPEIDIEIIPGITSVTASLAKAKVFVNESVLITTQDFAQTDVAVVLKAKKPREIAEKLKKMGFEDFILVEKMFMEGERISKVIPERASYFSVLIGLKR
uniref:Precorrin-2 methylase n=1 Tax=Geoglobus ahangari TaxID=113653 RepID=A0A7C3UC72_9EURY